MFLVKLTIFNYTYFAQFLRTAIQASTLFFSFLFRLVQRSQLFTVVESINKKRFLAFLTELK